MCTIGSLLEESVQNSDPLPPGYEGIWDKFFERIRALIAAAARRDDYVSPKVAAAMERLKDAIRSIVNVVDGRTHFSNETISKAALTLKEEVFSQGLDVVTENRRDIFGWALLTLRKLAQDYATESDEARISMEVTELETAVENYKSAAGRNYLDPRPEDLPKSQRKLRDEAREELRGVMLELGHATKRHPECIPVVNAMLRPLVELTEQIRAENRQNAQDDGDDDTSETEVEETEAEAEDDSGEDAEASNDAEEEEEDAA